MYQAFYSLREKPFSVTSNPAFLYLSQKHKEALSALLYGITQRVGFIEITGEVGTGKTTICRAILNQLDQKTKTAYIFNSNLTGLELMQTIVDDLGIETKRRNKGALFSALNQFLIRQLTLGNNVVLIIDEAQNLSSRSLEQIRMLSNLEADNQKLIQIVLVGQPELRKKLKDPALRQLRQWIAVRYHIEALTHSEVPQYIHHRLKLAGANGSASIFEANAVQEIFNYSGGIPRLINMVCDKALLMGYVFEQRNITANTVVKSITEIEGGD